MHGTPYERLTASQEFIEGHLTRHLRDYKPPKKGDLDSRIEVLGRKLDAVTGKDWKLSDYSTLIESLEEQRDLSQGITWEKFPHEDGTKSLVRNATSAIYPPPTHSPHSFAIQFLNVARAAELLIDQEIDRITDGRSKGALTPEAAREAKILLRAEVRNILAKAKAGEKIDIAKENYKIFTILDTVGIKKSDKILKYGKEFGGLMDSQYHVSTVTKHVDAKGEVRLAVESDAMMLGLTDSQKAQYAAIATSKIGDKVELEGADMSWYNDLPDYHKDLVHKYSGQLAKGDMIIPTQLRKIVIGLRNAHAKSTYVSSPDGKSLELVARGMHTGTVSFHGKGDPQIVADENAAQLKLFVPEGASVNINILNSPANPTGIDKAIHKQLGIAQERAGGSRSTTPVNPFRLVSSNDNAGFMKAVSEIALVTDNLGLTDISTFLRTGKGEKAARSQLEASAGYDKLLTAVEYAIEARHYIEASHALKDPTNSNVQLASYMKLLEFSAHYGVIAEYCKSKDIKLTMEFIDTQCASGKDRTGLTEIETSRKAIAAALGFPPMTDLSLELTKSLVAGSHSQFMTSNNGGTRGAHGLKDHTQRAQPKFPYSHIVGLFQKTASYNKFKMDKPNKLSEAIRKFIEKIKEILGKKEKPQVTIETPTRSFVDKVTKPKARPVLPTLEPNADPKLQAYFYEIWKTEANREAFTPEFFEKIRVADSGTEALKNNGINSLVDIKTMEQLSTYIDTIHAYSDRIIGSTTVHEPGVVLDKAGIKDDYNPPILAEDIDPRVRLFIFEVWKSEAQREGFTPEFFEQIKRADSGLDVLKNAGIEKFTDIKTMEQLDTYYNAIYAYSDIVPAPEVIPDTEETLAKTEIAPELAVDRAISMVAR